jgi:UDP-N-acetylglucosamine 2-epimerase
MEAGNRCFDQRVPEEINRKIIDHTSDINMTHTEHARRYLLAEGIRPETVIKTGSPMEEVLAYYRPQIQASDVLQRMQLSPREFFVVSAHREENVDDPLRLGTLLRALNAAVEKYGKTAIFSTHPRTRKRLGSGDLPAPSPKIQFVPPMGFFDYVKLQEQSFCVISDSGTLTEESSALGFPGVMIRDAHERPEGMDEGIVVMAGLSQDRVLECIDVVTSHVKEGRPHRKVPDYQAPDLSRNVHRIIVSYIDYVNRTVWRK